MFNSCKEVSVDRMFVIGMEGKRKKVVDCIRTRDGSNVARKQTTPRHGKLTRGRTVKVAVQYVYSSVTDIHNANALQANCSKSVTYLDEMQDIDLQRSNGYLQRLSLLDTADFIDSKHSLRMAYTCSYNLIISIVTSIGYQQ